MAPHSASRAGIAAVAALLALGIFVPARVHAQDSPYVASDTRLIDIKTKDGTLKFKPDFHIRELFDNNIFLESNLRDEDWITLYEPALGLELKTKPVEARVNYQATWKEYTSHDDRDVLEHNGDAFLKVKFAPFFIRTTAGWSRTYAPIENLAIPLAKSTQRTQSVTLGYDHQDWGLELEYDRLAFDLEKSLLDFFDHTSQSVTLRGVKKLSETVTGIAELTGGQTDFDQSIKNGDDFYQGLVGVLWRPSTKVNLSARAGYRSVDYETRFGSPFLNDFGALVYAFNLTWTPTTSDKVRIGTRRTVQESILSNWLDTYSIDGSYTRKLTKGWLLTPFVGYAHIAESATAALQDQKRFKTIGVNTTYDLTQGVMLEGGWLYRRKTTNDLGGEYVDQQMFVGARVRF